MRLLCAITSIQVEIIKMPIDRKMEVISTAWTQMM